MIFAFPFSEVSHFYQQARGDQLTLVLWTYSFHELLESLHQASFSSLLALEHLQDYLFVLHWVTRRANFEKRVVRGTRGLS